MEFKENKDADNVSKSFLMSGDVVFLITLPLNGT